MHFRLTGVPHRWLKHKQCVISQKVADDESSVHVNRFVCFHLSKESQNITLQTTPETIRLCNDR